MNQRVMTLKDLNLVAFRLSLQRSNKRIVIPYLRKRRANIGHKCSWITIVQISNGCRKHENVTGGLPVRENYPPSMRSRLAHAAEWILLLKLIARDDRFNVEASSNLQGHGVTRRSFGCFVVRTVDFVFEGKSPKYHVELSVVSPSILSNS